MRLQWSEIVPGRLWIGGFVRPSQAKWLRKQGITAVFSLQTDQDMQQCGLSAEALAEALKKQNLEWVRVPVVDFSSKAISDRLGECVARLEASLSRDNARVYLHCTVGINRSPTVAAAYLVRNRGYSAHEAYRFVTARRPCSPYLEVLEAFGAGRVPGAPGSQNSAQGSGEPGGRE